jgi:hypothetical protein
MVTDGSLGTPDPPASGPGGRAEPRPAGKARPPGLPDRVVRYGIWLAVLTRSLGDRRFQASVITAAIGAYALASVIKNNQARPVRRAIRWYSMEGQIRDAKGLHRARQAVQPDKR